MNTGCGNLRSKFIGCLCTVTIGQYKAVDAGAGSHTARLNLYGISISARADMILSQCRNYLSAVFLLCAAILAGQLCQTVGALCRIRHKLPYIDMVTALCRDRCEGAAAAAAVDRICIGRTALGTGTVLSLIAVNTTSRLLSVGHCHHTVFRPFGIAVITEDIVGPVAVVPGFQAGMRTGRRSRNAQSRKQA